MLESYDSKALYAIFSKIVVVIVVKVEEGMHDMHRIITNRVPNTHIERVTYLLCVSTYICANSQKNVSLKMTWAMYIHIYFSYLLPPDSFFINKGKTTTTLRQLPRYISYAQSALFFKICA